MTDSDRGQEAAGADAAETPKRNWRQALLQKKWIVSAAGAALAAAAIIVVVARQGANPSSAAGAEVTLGDFEFSAGDVAGILIQKAKFRLHVSLLQRAEQAGQALLAARQFKVQQEVEQLLRRAKSADFEDPLLADLKRQLQEMINETLGARVVEEIIITDLTLTRAEPLTQPAFDSAATSTTSAPAETTNATPASPTESDVIY